jgi:Fis family transcriptional regulator
MSDSSPKNSQQANESTPCVGVELIAQAVEEALSHYFEHLDGHTCCGLYDMVIQAVEKPLFETVLHHTNGNMSQAATLLGINRGTLRKRLREQAL